MPIASQTDAQPTIGTRSSADVLCALLTAFATTPHPALWLWCGPWSASMQGPRR